MAEFNSNNFKYSGRRYSFQASLQENLSENSFFTFDNQYIDEFAYVNELNGLYLTGHLIYRDKTGVVGQYFNKFYTYCEVTVNEMKDRSDGQITVSTPNKDFSFNHTFIIDNIEILERIADQNIIKYKINLISIRWYNLIANINYTNYQDTSKSILDIMKQFLVSNRLKVGKSFDKVKTGVNIDYITQENDNIFTTFDYLFQKMFFYDVTDNSVKFLYYNEYSDSYELLDTANKDTFGKPWTAMISLFGSATEGMGERKPTNFSSIVRMPKSDMFQSFFDYSIHKYDLATNSFSTNTFGEDNIIGYFNRKPDDYKYKNRVSTMPPHTMLSYKNIESYWDNNENVYQKQVKNILDQDSLVLTVDGILTRTPSDLMDVSIDKDANDIKSADKNQFDNVMKRYKQYEGIWLIGKVITRITPNSAENISSFRQEVNLFRNWLNEK